jgi:uncharacterized protein YxjI
MTTTLAARPARPVLDPAFQQKRFLLRQKVLRISEKYSVWDEEEREILFVHRPAHALRQIGALLAGSACGVVALVAAVALSALLPEAYEPFVAVPGIIGAIVVAIWVGVALSVKRHVTFYRDDSMRETLLRVRQEQKFAFLRVRFTIETPDRRPLAMLSKNLLSNVFRRRWTCHAPNGGVLCVVLEDSIVLAIARRLLGPMLGLLRTNFVFFAGEPRREIARFDRKFTIRDHYVLDLSADEEGVLDPRIGLAIGVMLDTGEKR